MMNIKQFEIWLADLNPQIGTEPGKVRPVIVIQTDLLNKHHPSTIICPITTQVKKDAEILRVNLKGMPGLDRDCDVMIDQMRAIDNKRLVKKIGKADEEIRSKIVENIKVVLDLF